LPRPLGSMLGRMEGVNTTPKNGPAARYGYRASMTGSATVRPLRRACALWWGLVRRKGMHCQRGSARGPRGPQDPLGIPRPSPSLVGLSRLFGTFFCPQGGYLLPRAKTAISDAQGGTGGVWGWKGEVQGSPMDPSDGPHSRFGRARYLNSDPLFGVWGCSTTAMGQNPGRQC
jgi:hypothetical protein